MLNGTVNLILDVIFSQLFSGVFFSLTLLSIAERKCFVWSGRGNAQGYAVLQTQDPGLRTNHKTFPFHFFFL